MQCSARLVLDRLTLSTSSNVQLYIWSSSNVHLNISVIILKRTSIHLCDHPQTYIYTSLTVQPHAYWSDILYSHSVQNTAGLRTAFHPGEQSDLLFHFCLYILPSTSTIPPTPNQIHVNKTSLKSPHLCVTSYSALLRQSTLWQYMMTLA